MFFPGKVLILSMLKQRTEAVAQSCSVKKVVCFAKSTRKHLCQSFFFNKVAGFFFKAVCTKNDYKPEYERNKRKRGFGKKEIFEGNKCFICKSPSIKEFLNFLVGQRIMPKISQFF